MRTATHSHRVYTVIFENVTLVEADLVKKLLSKCEPLSDSGKAVIKQLIDAFDIDFSNQAST